MDKLLELVQKLRDSVVPAEKLSKLNKKQIITFIEDAKVLEKMRVFHDKTKAKAMKSIVNDVEEEGIVPDSSDLKKLSVSKLRKLLRDFHRDIGLKQKHSKMSASKLRSWYQEMLYGDDDMKFLMLQDDKKEKKGKGKKERKEPKEPKEPQPKESKSTGSVVNVYTGESKAEDKEKCGCDEVNILEELDAQGIIMKLAPELYRSLMAKSYLLDLCNLSRMRREHEVCAVACDPKAYNRWACCENPCCPGQGTQAARGRDPGMVEVREGARVGDIGSFEDDNSVQPGGGGGGGRGLFRGGGSSSGIGPGPGPRPPRTPRIPIPPPILPPPPGGRTPRPPRTPKPPKPTQDRGGRRTGPRPPKRLYARTTQTSLPVPKNVVKIIDQLNHMENISNNIPSIEDLGNLVKNFTNPIIKNKINDHEDERENIRQKVDDLINNIDRIDNDVIERNIVDLINRVQNLNSERNNIVNQIKHLLQQSNVDQNQVKNLIDQLNKIQNDQKNVISKSIDQPINVIDHSQAIINVQQALINKLTKSTLLNIQNKNTENTRQNIQNLKNHLRNVNKAFNRAINNPENELRDTLNPKQR